MEATPCQQFLEQLLGSYLGEGSAIFPTTGSQNFNHQVQFFKPEGKTVKPVVMTAEQSQHPEKKVGMHFSNGFMRCIGQDQLQWLLAHNSGNTEALSGKVTLENDKNEKGNKVWSAILESGENGIGGDPFTKETKRVILLNPKKNTMDQHFAMRTETVKEVTPHLFSTFVRAAVKK